MPTDPGHPDEAAAWQDLRTTQDPQRRRELVSRIVGWYLPLVHDVAAGLYRYMVGQAEFDDLVQDGARGLLQAIDAFDPGRGVRFRSFAIYRIRGAIQDGVRDRDRVPRHERRQQRRLAELARSLGRQPELADLLAIGMSPDVARRLLSPFPRQGSLTDPISDRSDRYDRVLRQIDVLPAAGAAIGAAAEARDELRRALAGLTRTDRMILTLYYGSNLTLAETGRAIGTSESRVCQRLANLRERLRARVGANLQRPAQGRQKGEHANRDDRG